jgi:hypothetical protein
MGWRRIGLLVIAAWLAAIAVTFERIATAADLDALLPEVGAPILIAAGAAVSWLFVRPTSRTAYRVAAVLGPVGLIVRPLVVFLNYAAGFTRSGWSVIAAALVYGALALGGGLWWIFKVGPWLGRQRANAMVPGD